MESPRFGIIIRVHDLQACRCFYRDVLGLGDPVMDSGFAVEFRPSEWFSLRLEESAAPYLEHASAATSWVLESDDPAELRQRLEDYGCPMSAEPEERNSGDFFRGSDPEGNAFYVTCRRPADHD